MNDHNSYDLMIQETMIIFRYFTFFFLPTSQFHIRIFLIDEQKQKKLF